MPFDALPESIVSDLVKLRIARDGLASKDGWCQGKFGLENDRSHCVIGWLLKATEYDERESVRLLVKYIYPALPKSAQLSDRIEAVYRFNDRQRKPAVTKLLDDALRLAAST
jgi:hypothetical protein